MQRSAKAAKFKLNYLGQDSISLILVFYENKVHVLF